MAQITYDNKSYLYENPSIPNVNKVTDDDMNEIKSVVNTNASDLAAAVTDVAGLKGTILWTNPSPSSTYGTGTINLSSSNYDILEFVCSYVYNNSSVLISQRVPKGKSPLISAHNAGNNVSRVIDYANDTKYTARSSYQNATASSNYVIPLYVIGYKTGLF